MSKPVVFVIGASGSVGTATVTALSAKYADKVEIRAGMRRPEKAEKLKTLPNVTTVQATMGDSKLVDTFTGVSTLFIVTATSKDRAELTIKTAEYAKQAHVKHIVLVSLLMVDYPEKIFGGQLSQVERSVSKLGVPYTFVRPSFFMENYILFMKQSIVEQGAIFYPVDPDVPFMPLALQDLGNVFATILVNPEKHANKTYRVYGDRHSHGDFAKELSKLLGREIKYIRIPYEVMKKGMLDTGAVEEWQADGVLEGFQLIDAGSPVMAGNDLGVYKSITGEDPTSYKEWLANNLGAFQ